MATKVNFTTIEKGKEVVNYETFNEVRNVVIFQSLVERTELEMRPLINSFSQEERKLPMPNSRVYNYTTFRGLDDKGVEKEYSISSGWYRD